MKAHKRHVLATLMSVALTLGVSQVMADVIVSDSFESGDMSAPGFPGFSWGGNNRTSVVNSTHAIWNNGPINNPKPEGRNWTAFDGENSLRFRYPAGENWTEQRWSLDQGHPELWMSFWIRIPFNFSGPGAQTKFFSIWMDGYSSKGDGSTVWMDYNDDGSMGITHSEGGGSTSSGYEPAVPVFDPVNDRGNWFKFVVQVVIESSPGAGDGSMRVWHKRDGDESLVLSHEATDWGLKVPEAGVDGWAEGYLLGYVNSPYDEDTEWLLDDFTLSTTPLLNSPPRPPQPVEP